MTVILLSADFSDLRERNANQMYFYKFLEFKQHDKYGIQLNKQLNNEIYG
jgi:hypothetical protein